MSKHHVVPRADRWAVKGEGKARASAVFATQAEAIAAAKRIAANQGGYVLIHRRDGTIRTERVERIAGTIKVDVDSGESLTVVQRKIERADKRLKALAAKVATKKKTRDRKAAKKASPSGAVATRKSAPKRAGAAKPAAKKTAARNSGAAKPTAKKAKVTVKKPAVKKTSAKKPAAKKATTGKPTAKRATAKKSGAAKPTARKSVAKDRIGGTGMRVIIKSASKAMKRLVAKK